MQNLGRVTDPKDLTTKEYVDGQVAGKQQKIQPGTISFSTSWLGSGPYTQTVTVTGATVDANSEITLKPSVAQLEQLLTDGVTALVVNNDAGTLTATAIGAAPTAAFVCECKVTEVVA